MQKVSYLFTVDIDHDGYRLDKFLQYYIKEYSRSCLSNWIHNNCVTVNEQVVIKSSYTVKIGQIIKLVAFDIINIDCFVAEKMPIDVIYEDDALLVVNKPPGLVVHMGSGNLSGTLLNGLLYRNKELFDVPRAGIIHRLDKDTSGLLVVAKSYYSYCKLVSAMKDHLITRKYYALVTGQVASCGTIDANITRDARNRKRMCVVQCGGKNAVTHFQVREYLRNNTFSLIQCTLETGRTHQIRVHCKFIGHPIIGDRTYNNNRVYKDTILQNLVNDLGRQALHAYCLSFVHPHTTRQLTFKIRLEGKMSKVIEYLQEEK